MKHTSTVLVLVGAALAILAAIFMDGNAIQVILVYLGGLMVGAGLEKKP